MVFLDALLVVYFMTYTQYSPTLQNQALHIEVLLYVKIFKSDLVVTWNTYIIQLHIYDDKSHYYIKHEIRLT